MRPVNQRLPQMRIENSILFYYQVCSDGFYGDPCTPCGQCFNDAACDKTSGACPGGFCKPGWQGPRCDQGKCFKVKPVYNGNPKKDQQLVFKTNYHLI